MSAHYTRQQAKARDEERIAADVDAFLQSGQEITEIPLGVSADRYISRRISNTMIYQRAQIKKAERG